MFDASLLLVSSPTAVGTIFECRVRRAGRPAATVSRISLTIDRLDR